MRHDQTTGAWLVGSWLMEWRHDAARCSICCQINQPSLVTDYTHYRPLTAGLGNNLQTVSTDSDIAHDVTRKSASDHVTCNESKSLNFICHVQSKSKNSRQRDLTSSLTSRHGGRVTDMFTHDVTIIPGCSDRLTNCIAHAVQMKLSAQRFLEDLELWR